MASIDEDIGELSLQDKPSSKEQSSTGSSSTVIHAKEGASLHFEKVDKVEIHGPVDKLATGDAHHHYHSQSDVASQDQGAVVQSNEGQDGKDTPDAVPLNAPDFLEPSRAAAQDLSGSSSGPGEPNPKTGSASIAGQRTGPEGETRPAEINMLGQELNKDLVLHETAEKLAGICNLREIALRLKLQESEVARIEIENSHQLVSQFYQVFQLLSKQTISESEMFKKLIGALMSAEQIAVASWLRKEIGWKEPEASIAGQTSSPVSDVIPQTGATGRNTETEFFDIFLMCSGPTESKRKFLEIAKRHNWSIKTSDNIEIGTPVYKAIERILRTSTHLAVILTESDCINYDKTETSMAIEMALQMAHSKGELAGKVLPIRCCQKHSLPLNLQALTGAHIDEDGFEERLVSTVNTKMRLDRLKAVKK